MEISFDKVAFILVPVVEGEDAFTVLQVIFPHANVLGAAWICESSLSVRHTILPLPIVAAFVIKDHEAEAAPVPILVLSFILIAIRMLPATVPMHFAVSIHLAVISLTIWRPK